MATRFAAEMLAALNGAALAGDDLDQAVAQGECRQIGGVLDEAWDIGAHGQHPVMEAGEQVHDAAGIAARP